MKQVAMLAFALLLPFASVHASEAKPYELPRTEVVPITDSNTGRRYELFIQLPENYSENTDKSYPAIYMTDGEMQMDMLSGTAKFLMPDAILVGISGQLDENGNNVPGSRGRDFTIIKYEHVDRPTGEAANYLAFLRGDIIPYVEKRFRTKPDERAYWGYSSAGEFGAYALLAKPGTFKHYILGGPALDRLSTNYLDELEAEMAPQQQALSVNVFVSLAEHERPGRLELVQEFMSILGRRSETGVSVTGLEIIKDSTHMSAVPETFLRSIKWLSALTAE